MGSLYPGKGKRWKSVKHLAVEDNNLSGQLEAEGWDENRKDIPEWRHVPEGYEETSGGSSDSGFLIAVQK